MAPHARLHPPPRLAPVRVSAAFSSGPPSAHMAHAGCGAGGFSREDSVLGPAGETTEPPSPATRPNRLPPRAGGMTFGKGPPSPNQLVALLMQGGSPLGGRGLRLGSPRASALLVRLSRIGLQRGTDPEAHVCVGSTHFFSVLLHVQYLCYECPPTRQLIQ